MLAIGKMKPDSISVGRNDDEQRQLKRDLLRVGDARDQQAEPERADQEQRQRDEQQQPRPAHRQAEQRHRDEDDRRAPRPARSRSTGSSCRARTRAASSGAIRTCSIVPRSFSRTIDSAVETTARDHRRCRRSARAPGTACCAAPGCTRRAARRRPADRRDPAATAAVPTRSGRSSARSPSPWSRCSRCRRSAAPAPGPASAAGSSSLEAGRDDEHGARLVAIHQPRRSRRRCRRWRPDRSSRS